MSIQTLPPVWEKWADEELDTLDVPQLRVLHLSMTKKLYQLEDRLDRCIFFDGDEKYAKIMNRNRNKNKNKKRLTTAS
jgi:hypothetical protein